MLQKEKMSPRFSSCPKRNQTQKFHIPFFVSQLNLNTLTVCILKSSMIDGQGKTAY